MGCKESKLDVATGNTVAHSKKSKADNKRVAPPETRPDDKSGILVAAVAAAAAASAAAGGNHAVRVNGKEEGESRDLDRESEGSEEEEKDVERSIFRESPNHYFSSRKDDESVDAISVEERSVYSSPPHEAAGGKEIISMFSKETTEKTEMEKINGNEHVGVKEHNLNQKSEMVRPQTNGLSVEKKIANIGEENVTHSSKDDQNTKQERTLMI